MRLVMKNVVKIQTLLICIYFLHLGYVHFANYFDSFCRRQNDVSILLAWRFGGLVIGILCPLTSQLKCKPMILLVEDVVLHFATHLLV